MDGMNPITTIIAVFNNKGKVLMGREMLMENVELVKIAKEIRNIKKQRIKR